MVNWTLEYGRQRVGLDPADVTKDADIEFTMRLALEAAEKFCDRRFPSQDVLGEFVEVDQSRRFFVERYPLQAIHQISVDGMMFDYSKLDAPLIKWNIGEVIFREGCCNCRPGYSVVRIWYRGGFVPLPDTLVWVLWQIFDECWRNLAGSASGGGASMSGEISRITVPDVGSVTMVTSADLARASSSGNGEPDIIPPTARNTLWTFYRRWAC